MEMTFNNDKNEISCQSSTQTVLFHHPKIYILKFFFVLFQFRFLRKKLFIHKQKSEHVGDTFNIY